MAETKTKKPKKAKKEKKILELPRIEGAGEVKEIELEQIVANTAQSRGMGLLVNLTEQGYGLFEKTSADKDAIWLMLFSPKPEKRKAAVELLERNEKALVKFAESLHLSNQLQDIGVLRVDDGYDVIFGMRRALGAAYNSAKWEGSPSTIRARVFDQELGKTELKLLALAENDNRENESVMDKAITYAQIMEESGCNQSTLSDALGVSKMTVSNYIRLLDPKIEDKRVAIHNGAISVERALAILDKRNGKTTGGGGKDNENKMPSVKGMAKLYNAPKKPEKMPEEEWQLWIAQDVRKLLALKLGLEYKEWEPAPEPVTPRVLKVARERLNLLGILLGKTDIRTWGDDKVLDFFSNVPNNIDDSVDVSEENEGLQRLLDKLRECYTSGTTVTLLDKKGAKGKKGKKGKAPAGEGKKGAKAEANGKEDDEEEDENEPEDE